MHFYIFFQTSASAPMLPPRDLSPPPLPPRPSGRRSSTVEHPSGSPSRHMFFNGPQPHHSTGIQISLYIIICLVWGGEEESHPQFLNTLKTVFFNISKYYNFLFLNTITYLFFKKSL